MGAGDNKKVCCEAAIALCGLSLVFIKDWRVEYLVKKHKPKKKVG